VLDIGILFKMLLRIFLILRALKFMKLKMVDIISL